MRYGTLVAAAAAAGPGDVVVGSGDVVVAGYTDVGAAAGAGGTAATVVVVGAGTTVVGPSVGADVHPAGSETIDGPFGSISTDEQPKSEKVVSAVTVPPSSNITTVWARRMKPSPSTEIWTVVVS